MASFSFDVDGKTVRATVEKIRGANSFKYEASGQCPFCGLEFKTGDKPGELRKEGEVKSSLKFNIKRHRKSYCKAK